MRKRRLNSILLSAVFIFSNLFANVSYADTSSYIKIELDKTKAGVGDIIEASLMINNIDEFASYNVNIKYDPTVLQPAIPSTGKRGMQRKRCLLIETYL